MERSARLTATFAKSVTEPGRYGDGRGGYGLALLVQFRDGGGVHGSVRDSVRKSWVQRLRINGRVTNLGLGPVQFVSLKEARERAFENAREVYRGNDPRTAKRAQRAVPTFAQAAETVIKLHAANWKASTTSEREWRSSLTMHAYPRLRSMPVDKIETADVLAVLAPIWNPKRVTAKRVRQRISAVMCWAVAKGHRSDDPADKAILQALPKNGHAVKRMKALPHAQTRDALARVRELDMYEPAKLAFEFLVLTATRSGETREATWSEIDVSTATWTIPAERTKTGMEHRVPLSPQALDVLERAADLGDGFNGLVFPSERKASAMRAHRLTDVCTKAGIDATPHGFRSTFRDWCGETGVPHELAEMALAHTVTGVEGAYARSDLLERRRDLMADWAEYISPA